MSPVRTRAPFTRTFTSVTTTLSVTWIVLVAPVAIFTVNILDFLRII